MQATKAKAAFIEPMLLLRKESLPEGPEWLIELKLDGYRALAFRTAGKVQLRSRNDSDFNARYPGIVKALAALPDDTVIDGEVVALDEEGRPSFNTLQNHGSSLAPVHFFIFDLLILKGRNVMDEPLNLHDQRVYTGFRNRTDRSRGFGEFVLEDECVERQTTSHAPPVQRSHCFGQLAKFKANLRAGAKVFETEIARICSSFDRRG
jgi:hypothetical protein